MSSLKRVSKKVILLGHFGVGKTSLVRRFVHQKFSEEYLTTIGVKVDKKVLEVSNNEITMIIWDIEGGAVQSKLPKSYFLGAHGIIYVSDLTRPSTYENMDEELAFFYELLPNAALQLVANKRDLLDEFELKNFEENHGQRFNFLSSAKTGENVEDLFRQLGIEMIQ